MQLTQTDIATAFESLLPELERRLNLNARRYTDAAEAFQEMLASSWVNFQQKAKHGSLLNACALAWIARIRLQAGRVLCGYSAADALAEKTVRSGRSRVLSLSQMTTTKPRWKLAPGEIRRITLALSSCEHARPLDRAAVRLDWAALAERLDRRLRVILEGLAVGESKSSLAKILKVTCGRISQLLAVLKREIVSFFGENLPDSCW
ncbi:MAG TPA: hypothetical protein VKV04_02560 [Verrucomicrobiae bacterium]|nr:hypothetical protein [Verrucomicrobiae bacterium]